MNRQRSWTDILQSISVTQIIETSHIKNSIWFSMQKILLYVNYSIFLNVKMNVQYLSNTKSYLRFYQINIYFSSIKSVCSTWSARSFCHVLDVAFNATIFEALSANAYSTGRLLWERSVTWRFTLTISVIFFFKQPFYVP